MFSAEVLRRLAEHRRPNRFKVPRKLTISIHTQLDDRFYLFARQSRLNLSEIARETFSTLNETFVSSSRESEMVEPNFAKSFAIGVAGTRNFRVTGGGWHTFDLSDPLLNALHCIATKLRTNVSVVCILGLDMALAGADIQVKNSAKL
jgi:hypothetical protein